MLRAKESPLRRGFVLRQNACDAARAAVRLRGQGLPCPIPFCSYRISTYNGGLKAACYDGILCIDLLGKGSGDGAAGDGEDPPGERKGAHL